MTPDTSRENIVRVLREVADCTAAMSVLGRGHPACRRAYALADALAAPPDEAPVAWAMRDKTTGVIVSVDTKPPYDPKFIPPDWTREQIPLYATPAASTF